MQKYFLIHIQKFVVLKNEVLTYVDFTPPWTSPYFELRKKFSECYG